MINYEREGRRGSLLRGVLYRGISVLTLIYMRRYFFHLFSRIRSRQITHPSVYLIASKERFIFPQIRSRQRVFLRAAISYDAVYFIDRATFTLRPGALYFYASLLAAIKQRARAVQVRRTFLSFSLSPSL